MAVSKHRKKNHILKRQKNQIRGALASNEADLASVVIDEMADLTEFATDQLLDWLAGYPAKKKRLLPPVPATKYSELQPNRHLNTRNIRLELLWITRFLARNKERIEYYLTSLIPLQDAWIDNDEASVLAQIKNIEDQCGLSAWLISARLAALQRFQGLEAQKNYQRAVHSAAPYSFSAFLAYYISQRNEPAVTLNRLQQSVERALNRPNVLDGLVPFTRVFIDSSPISSLEQEGLFDYLSIASSLSIIDAYEAFLSVVIEWWRRGLIETLPHQSLQLLQGLTNKDYRVAKLCALFDPSTTDIPFAVANAEASFFRGDFLQASGELLTRLDQDPCDVDAFRLLCTACARLASPVPDGLPQIIQELGKLLVELKQRGEHFERAAAESSKILANIRHLPFAAGFAAAFASEWSATPMYGRSDLVHCYFGTRSHNTLHAIHIGQEHEHCFLNKTPIDPSSQLCVEVAARFLAGEPLPPDFAMGDARTEWRTFSLLSAGQLDKALVHARLLSSSDQIYARRLGVLLELHALCALGQFDEAIVKLGIAAASDSALGKVMPAELLLSGKRWRDIRHLKKELALAIGLDTAAQKHADPDTTRNLRFAFDEFLRSVGVAHPSSLSTRSEDFHKPCLVYFLRYVCVPSVMDVSFQTFKTSRDLEDERIRICNVLSELDPDHSDAYAEEVKSLTRLVSIQDGLRDVDQSRLYVSTDSLLAWAQREFAEGFERYKSLLKAGVGFAPESEYESVVTQFLTGDSAAYEDYLKYPRDEADNLLAEMYQDLRTQYLTNPDYGLDAYLSMRVRHGSLSGHLRGPLEQRHLVLTRDDKTGIYSALPANSPLLKDASESDQIVLSDCLRTFSITIDDIIDDLIKTRLQIQNVDKKEGMFTQRSIPIAHLFLRSRIQQHTTLSEFLSTAIVIVEVLLQRDLTEVRKYLTEVVKGRLEVAISALRQSAATKLMAMSAAHVGREITDSIPEALAALERIVEWFRPAQAYQTGTLRSFDEIIEIGITATKNARRGFEPVITDAVEDLGYQSGEILLLFSDLLFTILDNVYRHSGLGNTPAVHISLGATKQSDNRFVVTLHVASAVAPGVKSESTLERLQRIRTLIDSGSYRNLVNREGGTGLIKIQRLIASNPRNTLQFGFDDDERFFVTVKVNLLILTEAQSKSMGLT